MKRALLALALSAQALPCRAEPARPEDFAFALELSAETAGPVHVFTVPERVLAAVHDRELADLCVFDGQGRPLAQALAGDEPAEPARTELPVAFFPLEAREHGGSGGLAVSIERAPSGAIAHAFWQPDGAAQRDALAYLLDRGEDAAPLEALTLTFAGEQPFTVQADVDASEDLAHFSPLASATLARLEHDGHRLRRERVELPPSPTRYLRLRVRDAPQGLTLDAVRAQVARPNAARARRFVELTARARRAGDDQLFSYELAPAFQPDRYRLALPAPTVLVEAALESGPSTEGPFHQLDRGLFQRGDEPERELPATRDRFFQLRVASKGGGVQGGSPRLALGYRPPRLLFSAAAGGPYLLAYASARTRCGKFDPRQLASLTPRGLPSADTVRALRTRTLSGPAALVPREPARELRVYVLWGVLLACVVVLALIARRLVRQL